jgi:hypothetical protein
MISKHYLIECSLYIIYKQFWVSDIATGPTCTMTLLGYKVVIISGKMEVLRSNIKELSNIAVAFYHSNEFSRE